MYSAPPLPQPAGKARLGLPENATLCLYPHSPFKVHPDNDELLAEILRRRPDAMLILIASRNPALDRQLFQRLSTHFARDGIAFSQRVKVLDRVDRAGFLTIVRSCDLMLDTVHWSGGNTSLDAIAVGLPIVALRGPLMRGRQSAGMLQILGLEELVADSATDYVALVEQLCDDADRRKSLGAKLIARRHLLFDRREPIQALEHFLRQSCAATVNFQAE